MIESRMRRLGGDGVCELGKLDHLCGEEERGKVGGWVIDVNRGAGICFCV